MTRIRGLKLGALVGPPLVAMAIATAAPAQAYTESVSYYGYAVDPLFTFAKSTNTNSQTVSYVSIGNYRYITRMRAGSGTGTNDCVTNVGWLPNGRYSTNSGGDYGTRMDFMYKNWGSSVVQGWVWYVGNHRCSTGAVTRTELFIHSSGIEGTAWNDVYTSNGCIKISQTDRAQARSRWSSAWRNTFGALSVF